ncbi:peptide ABC transporter substrate-binding protein [Clavibacter michiganensis]|uniref:Bacterial extracellular solute-binding protein, family 5 Middle n=1 Tax=Clavibacter michiganensis TaxID=28447 RepID=A0A251XW72_9MICO|nr:Bacterial extracellular solute-binding protein, family 5 Middle [Clavibacter michiganensis]PPF52703.1 peptide ABC transporter substrate-binding protein [Clavibacter michiganensis]PPF68255.1 peptide ABC transporter substrate-binding protein [Clavibacter michiganensis]
MKIRRLVVAGAAIVSGALVLSGCSAPAQESEVIDGSSITVAWNDPFLEYNNLSATGNATANTNIVYLTNRSFNYYDDGPTLVKDEDFGTYEKVSDDPLVVKFTIKDGVKWSDGTPVDAADMLLNWAANTTNVNTVGGDDVQTDEETGAVTTGDDQVFFNSGAVADTRLGLVTQTPEIGDDGRSLTYTYDKPYVDWEVATGNGVGVSAHGTTQLAFPDDDLSAEDAKDKLITAIQDKDASVLAPVSKIWNDGYRYSDMPAEAQKTLATGQYVISDLKADQYVTLTANPEYTGSKKPKYQEITVRFIADPQAQIQALENGEVSIASGQPTADLLKQVQGLSGVEYKGQAEGTYEHVDLQTTNGGAFDAAKFGGDEEKAKLVRQAFFKTLPREEILEKLIKPLQEDAELRNSNVFVPGTENYEASVKENGYADQTVDIEGAKALLAEAGVTGTIDARVLYGQGNTRRQQEFELMRQSASQAGFNLIDVNSATWGADLSSKTDSYDIALFGWQSTSLAVGESGPNYQTGGINNYYGWSNPEIDDLFTQLDTETDPDKQRDILIQAETLIQEQSWTTPIFQFPGLTAWSDTVTGVKPAFLSPTFFWNFYEWAPANTSAE